MIGALVGKTVVITGSTRGIGRAIAEAAAAAGANVVVSSRTPAAVDAAIAEIMASGGLASGMPCDVSRSADLEGLLAHAIERWGRVDVWMNNAGISEGYRPVDELSAEEIRTIVDINLTGTMLACRLLVPYFREHGGVLINMAGRGYRGEATPYTASYAATKAAVSSLTKSLAAENKDAPVSIHAFVPGMVATDFYRDDMPCSPKLEASRGNVALALDAFGVPLDVVGREVVPILAQVPGRTTGKTYTLLRGLRLVRGIALMSWWGMSGKMKREP